MTTFKDHFSGHAQDYAQFRPTYPPALTQTLADFCSSRDMALDVGCGNGQLTRALGPHFHQVLGTDASAEQIAAAPLLTNVTFKVAPAEVTPLPNQSVDLVVAAQAAHWFDRPKFYADVLRLARPNAIIALICYGPLEGDPTIQPAITSFRNQIASYWPPERALVESGYRNLDFPFKELDWPDLSIDVNWNLQELVGYCSTWSSVKAYAKQHQTDPLLEFAQALHDIWGEPSTQRLIRFPLYARIGRAAS